MISEEQAKKIKEQLLSQLDKLPEEQASSIRAQIESASPEELETFLAQMQQQAQTQRSGTSGECLFCQIVHGKIETIRIYEDSDIIAVLDLYPASRGHVLVMPREHFQFIQEIPDNLLSKIFLFIKAFSPVLINVTGAKALSIYIPQGALAGQNINHFFINLIPRYEDKSEGINFSWQKQKAEKEELEKIGDKLRKIAKEKVTKTLETEKKKEVEKRKVEDKNEAEKIMKHIKERTP